MYRHHNLYFLSSDFQEWSFTDFAECKVEQGLSNWGQSPLSFILRGIVFQNVLCSGIEIYRSFSGYSVCATFSPIHTLFTLSGLDKLTFIISSIIKNNLSFRRAIRSCIICWALYATHNSMPYSFSATFSSGSKKGVLVDGYARASRRKIGSVTFEWNARCVSSFDT